MNAQTYPTTLHPDLIAALHTALDANDYRPIAGLIHGMYRKKEHRGSIEKYIRYDFTHYLQGVRDSLLEEEQSKLRNALEYFIVDLYKASVRNKIIEYIVYLVHTL